MPTEGWAVQLTGEQYDLDDARAVLGPAFDPWVEDFGSELLLRSRAWNSFAEAADVMRDAERLVERINGAARLLQPDALPLTTGRLHRFDASGISRSVILVSCNSYTLSGTRARARVGTFSPASPPTESPAQRWLRLAETDDTRNDLLAYLARADNWFDIYKAAELAETLAGGRANIRQAIGSRAWSDMCQTANVARHAPSPTRALPPNPPPLDEAKELLFRVARDLMD